MLVSQRVYCIVKIKQIEVSIEVVEIMCPNVILAMQFSYDA